jgi:hypothetical protein
VSTLFVLVFLAAIVGLFKPYIKGATRTHFGVAAVVSFFLIGIFAGKEAVDTGADNGAVAVKSGPSGEAASSPEAKPAEPTSKWEYSEDKDEMRGTSAKFAELQSENEVDLDFPYGVVHGRLWIRRRAEDGLNVAFEVEKGQVLCHGFRDSYVSIKFDDGPIKRYRCTGSSDGSSETAFLNGESGLVSELKRSKRAIVEAEFYQKGNQQFTFKTAGLIWK